MQWSPAPHPGWAGTYPSHLPGRASGSLLRMSIQRKRPVTLKMVEQAGGSGEIYPCDVTQVQEVQKMANYVFGAWGGLDLLVNNAGVAATGSRRRHAHQGLALAHEHQPLGNGLRVPCLYPENEAGTRGSYRQRCLGRRYREYARNGCYNVSKAAVISLSETLRGELAPLDIGVSVVCPTFFNTNLLRDMRYCDDFQCHLPMRPSTTQG